MLCQMCLQAEAAVHVLDRVPGGPPVQADYCPTCYDLKYVNPPARPPDFPRPRFTIRRLMILAAVFAIPNAAVVLVMRSGLILGTPAQIHDWTLQAFLFANSYCGLMALAMISMTWLRKVEWHKRTGDLIPMERPRKLGLKGSLALVGLCALLGIWFIGGISAIDRLAPLVWPGWRPDPITSTWIVSAPLYVWLGLRLRSKSHLGERFRALWRGASRRERLFRISMFVWMVLVGFLFSRPSRLSWSPNPLISLGLMMAIVMGGQLILMFGLAASTRRR
jgi:hypothetical protein